MFYNLREDVNNEKGGFEQSINSKKWMKEIY